MAIQYEYGDNPINDTPVSVNTCLELEGELSLECELEGELIGAETQPAQPILIDKNITDNGTYHASDDNADGYANVTVEVETDPPVLIEKSITDNGTYLASDDEADGYSSVSVSVPQSTLIEKSVNENGIYLASGDNADGYSKVTVEIPPATLITKSVSANGEYLASEDEADGYSKVTVNIQPVLEKYIYNIDKVEFNTGHKHTPNTKICLKAEFPYNYSYMQAFGARSNNFNNYAFGFFATFANPFPCLYRTHKEQKGSWYAELLTKTDTMFYGFPVILECEGKSASWYRVDDSTNVHELLITDPNCLVDNGIAPLGIFCGNNTTVADSWDAVDFAYMKLYWFEIYESDVLIHRYIPATNDNKNCLYDEVTETYLYEYRNNNSRLIIEEDKIY